MVLKPLSAIPVSLRKPFCALAGARFSSSAAAPSVFKDCLLDHLIGEHEGISVISLNRKHVKNAIGKNFILELQQHITALKNIQDIFDDSKDTCRVVILRSTLENVFCAGADLKERYDMTQDQVAPFVKSLRDTFTTLERLPFPIIAALDGLAIGGGLELAMAADIRIAQEQILLGLPETKLAILPGAGGTQRLARLIGPSKAKELIFMAKLIPASEAFRLGLVNECVPSIVHQYSSTLDSNSKSEKNPTSEKNLASEREPAYLRSLEVAKEIMQKGPVAIKMAKIAIMAGMEVDMNAALAIEEMCYAQVIPTVDRLEGLNSFKEARSPKYIGK